MKSTVQTIGLVLLVVLAGVTEISRSGASRVSENKSKRVKTAAKAVRLNVKRQMNLEPALLILEQEATDSLDEGSDFGSPCIEIHQGSVNWFVRKSNLGNLGKHPDSGQAASAAASMEAESQMQHPQLSQEMYFAIDATHTP